MKEIERKFLVKNMDFLKNHSTVGYTIQQAYLMESKDRSLRVRIKNQRAFLTLKIGENALERSEYEYEIPFKEAEELLHCCPRVLYKIRYEIHYQNALWEVDVFQKELTGLCIAEIELESPEQSFDLPEWVGEEVTQDPQYLNINLIKRLNV